MEEKTIEESTAEKASKENPTEETTTEETTAEEGTAKKDTKDKSAATQKKERKSIFSENEVTQILVFLAMLSAIYLPYVLKTITLLMVKKPLAGVVCVIFEIIGILGAVLLGAFAEKKYGIFEKKTYLASVLYVLGAVRFGSIFTERIGGLLVVRMLDKMPMYFIMGAVVFGLMAFLFAMALPTKGRFIKNVISIFVAMICI